MYQVDGFPEDADFHIDYELSSDDKCEAITEELTNKVRKLLQLLTRKVSHIIV